jgi:hypothetical protein
LQYLRAVRFEHRLRTTVVDTNRSTFDLYAEDGPFFDIPLQYLRGLCLLEPIVALFDTTGESASRISAPFAEAAIPNVYAVLATSNIIDGRSVHSRKVKPLPFYPLDLWPDNELHALE